VQNNTYSQINAHLTLQAYRILLCPRCWI